MSASPGFGMAPSVEPSGLDSGVRAELMSYLEADESRLGEVYRLSNKGMGPSEIADELEVATPNFVYNYSAIVRALLDGEVPNGPSVALQAARRFRKILKSALGLSSAARDYLATTLIELEHRAEDPSARVQEVQLLKTNTEAAEVSNPIGIYVYALPHYLHYPFEPETGRTLMKVGRSDSDAIVRFKTQTRTTALPEEPVLLRIYRTGSGLATTIESDFHGLLKAADMARSIARTAGKEWFVTSIKFLDEVARVMKLETVVVNDGVVEDDD